MLELKRSGEIRNPKSHSSRRSLGVGGNKFETPKQSHPIDSRRGRDFGGKKFGIPNPKQIRKSQTVDSGQWWRLACPEPAEGVPKPSRVGHPEVLYPRSEALSRLHDFLGASCFRASRLLRIWDFEFGDFEFVSSYAKASAGRVGFGILNFS